MSDETHNTSGSTGDTLPGRAVILFAGIIVLIALGFSVQDVLSPFLLVSALVFLLFPLRHEVIPRRLLAFGVLLFVAWLIDTLLGLLAPFIISFIIAYILNPLVTRLHRRGLPRWVGSTLCVVLLTGLFVGGILFIMPVAVQQFRSILAAINTIANDLSELLQSGTIFSVLETYGVPVDKARQFIGEQVSPRLENVLAELFGAVFGVVSGVSTVVLQIINAVLIPFLVLYMLMDFPQISQRFLVMMPLARRERVHVIFRKVDVLMASYFRGAITVALIQGTISAIALWLMGVKYALVLGIMTGLLNFIPYIGLITSLVVSSIVATFSGEPAFAKVVGVVILYLSQKLLEATLFGPKIIGSQVGLHPVVLILCILVFGFFMGFVGMLIAVPATALILAGFREWEAVQEAAQEAAVRKE